MKKDTFIFYLEWLRTMEAAELSRSERNKLIDAIVTYADTGAIPTLPRLLMAVFSPIKATLDRDKEKWEIKAAIVRENGAKGGRPKKPTETKQNQVGYLENQTKPNKTKTHVNVNDNVNDNDNYLTAHACARAIAPEEEKKIYEIFFWRNFKDPKAELDRFIDYNSQRKWKALNTPGKRLTSAYTEWQPADKTPRVRQQFLDMWQSLYERIKEEQPDVAADMIEPKSRCQFYGSVAKICARKRVRDFIETTRPPEVMDYIGSLTLTTSAS